MKNKRLFAIIIRWWFTAKMAMHGILANKLRSSLTVLGVAIGVASVVSLMGIGEGARQTVVAQFESLGSNVIKIETHHSSVEFEPEFVGELVERVDNLEMATPVVHTKTMMKWRRTRARVDLLGVNQHFTTIRDHVLISGNNMNMLHIKQRSPVAMLGYNVAVSMMGGRNVVGKSITLNEQTYKIIGVLAPKGAGNADDIDDKIVIPYTNAQKISEKRTIEEIWGKAASREQADLATVHISRIIKKRMRYGVQSTDSDENGMYETSAKAMRVMGNGMMIMEEENNNSEEPLPEIGEDLINVTNLNQLVEEADKANRVMTLLLGGIAAVSLLVGGLGIMNIMMVAVNERTEEIGVRRAMGAKQSDLLLQFLLEALYVSLIGAIVGTIAGVWGLGLFENLGFQTAVSFKAIRMATTVALISGLLFGVYPAVSASSVPPVEALRSQ